MVDSVVRTTHQGFLSRLFGSFVGVLIGILMIPGSVLLISWNEYRTIHRTMGLAEAEKAVAEVPNAFEIDNALDKRLVHLTGQATTEETLTDAEFSVSQLALRLRRQVEMYQWVEHKESKTRDKLGGGKETVTTYTYDRRWESDRIESDRFEEKSGHVNPPLKYHSKHVTAQKATVGAFDLRSDLVGAINDWHPLPVTLEKLVASVPEAERNKFTMDGERLYYSNSANSKPDSPQVGDLRIRFSIVEPTTVSILSMQTGNKLEPFKTSNGESVERIQTGNVTAVAMFESLKSENTIIAWLLRIGGWVLACVGFSLLTSPLKALANIIPFIGRIVDVATSLIGFLLGSVLALVTIAVAWIAVRPVMAIAILAVAAVGLFLLFRSRKSPEPPMAVLAD